PGFSCCRPTPPHIDELASQLCREPVGHLAPARASRQRSHAALVGLPGACPAPVHLLVLDGHTGVAASSIESICRVRRPRWRRPMSDSVLLGPLLQGFFSEHLTSHRQVSQQTVFSYRDTFRLLLRFIRDQKGIEPAVLTLDALDAPTILN